MNIQRNNRNTMHWGFFTRPPEGRGPHQPMKSARLQMRLEVCSPRQGFGTHEGKLLEIYRQHWLLQICRTHPEIMRSCMRIMKDKLIRFWLSWNASRWRKTRSILALTITRRRESHDPSIRKYTDALQRVFPPLHRQIRQLPNGDQGSTVQTVHVAARDFPRPFGQKAPLGQSDPWAHAGCHFTHRMNPGRSTLAKLGRNSEKQMFARLVFLLVWCWNTSIL